MVYLVCPSGHRTPHSLARVLRLNDGWCGTCGADIDNAQLFDADGKPHAADPAAQKACKIVPERN